MMRTILSAIAIVVGVVVLSIALYAGNIAVGMHSTATVSGTIAGSGVRAPVQILRDVRAVPHIRAPNDHDLFFAEGYVMAQDRLFQLDLLRRFVYGNLSEILGSAALRSDENARVVPVRAIVERQWQTLDAREQAMVQAFTDGVNAAAKREPTPVEFRVLDYDMKPWQPQDSLAVSFATVLDLTDNWNDIAARIGNEPLLTDPCFDAPVTEGLARVADPAHCSANAARAALIRSLLDTRPPIGSNNWAAGAAHTQTKRALLANDPHLHLGIPGVWYLVDMQAPGFHAAGATLVGTPGVTLGHNDRIAWGATNGTVTALSIFDRPASLDEVRRPRRHQKVLSRTTRVRHQCPRERRPALYSRSLECVRDTAFAVHDLRRTQPRAQHRGCARGAASLSGTNAELRARRCERPRCLSARR